MDIAKLQVLIETKGVEVAQRELDKFIAKSTKAEKSVDSLKNAFAAVGGVQLAREYAKISDSFTLLEARIKLVSSASADLLKVQKDLFNIAQSSRAEYASIGQLYTKLAQPLDKLGISTQSIVDITDAFSKALLISGASTEEANSSIRQFGQAMASGVLRGDEFNSMAENSPRVMKALSDELGVSSGALRKMAEDGKLTADILAGALLNSVDKLKKEAGEIPNTISGAFQQMYNNIGLTISEMNKASDAMEGVITVVKILDKTFDMFLDGWASIFASVNYGFKEIGMTYDKVIQDITTGSLKAQKSLLEMIPLADYSKEINALNLEILQSEKASNSLASQIAQNNVKYLTYIKSLDDANKAQTTLTKSTLQWGDVLRRERDVENAKAISDEQKRQEELKKAKEKSQKEAEKIAKKWADRKVEISTEMAISEQDELSKPFLQLQLEYQKDLEEFKSVVGAKELLAENFNKKYQRLGLDATAKIEEEAQKAKTKDIQKELKLQEENFRIQARQVELLDDEADKQVALATLEYQRTQASLKAQMQLGEISTSYYDAMMEMEDKLLEKQKFNASEYGQIANSINSQIKSGFDSFVDDAVQGGQDIQKTFKNVLQGILADIIKLQVTRPISSAISTGITSMFGGATPNATGGVYNSPSLSAYSNQVVDKPTFFAFASGGVPNLGVMGEKNGGSPEAIMPLTRTSSGDLGVKAEGMGLQQVKIQIINESGTQMEVTKTSQTTDMEGLVIQAWISGISKNRMGSRDLLGGR